MTLEEILQKKKILEQNFWKQKTQKEDIEKRLSEKKESIKQKIENRELLEKTRILLLSAAEFQRMQVKNEFESLVTQALQYILEEDIQFVIEVKQGKRAAIDFKITSCRDGIVTTTGIDTARGDGIGDVVSLALQIAMLEYAPNNKGPLILDEPAKQVSKEYVERVGAFLKEISVAFDRQIILVTHQKALADIADRKFEVKLKNNVSEVEVK